MEPSQIGQLIVLIFLLMLSAFFSSAETSLTTVSKFRIMALIEEGNKNAILVDKIKSNSAKMLSAILIGNNIVNISASSLATLLAQSVFGNYAVSIATGILTILVLIFGEITPKTMATYYTEQMALMYAKPIYALMWILTPIIFVINFLAGIILRLFGISKDTKMVSITEGELRTLVDVSNQEGVIENEECKIINNVFDFGDTNVRDIMIPRIDMTMADVNSSYDDILEIFRRDRYTRIPIYENSTDNVIGVINMKDLLLYNTSEEFNVRNYLREASYTYESKNLSDLMMEMKQNSVSIVIVLDEYGITAGLITLEDLLEEIVGDIRDEYDKDEENLIIQKSDNEYIVEGQINLEDINDKLQLDLDSDNYDSIGGIIIEQLDKLPDVGDFIELPGVKLTVLSLDKKRIDKVSVVKLKEESDSEED